MMLRRLSTAVVGSVLLLSLATAKAAAPETLKVPALLVDYALTEDDSLGLSSRAPTTPIVLPLTAGTFLHQGSIIGEIHTKLCDKVSWDEVKLDRFLKEKALLHESATTARQKRALAAARIALDAVLDLRKQWVARQLSKTPISKPPIGVSYRTAGWEHYLFARAATDALLYYALQ
jgi:hypothetical protein